MKTIRKAHGWTQVLLGERARAVGKDFGATFGEGEISRVERGEVENLRLAKIRALVLALETSADYLLGLTDDPASGKRPVPVDRAAAEAVSDLQATLGEEGAESTAPAREQ